MPFTPLPLVDDLLLPYHVGHALVAVFVLSILGTLPLGSRKVLSLNFLAFGLIFLLTPASQLGTRPFTFKFLGIALLVIAPVLYMTARS